MTFSIIARCNRTGMFGIAIATRPMAIGAKCPFLKAGVGGLVVQANGDPRLGPFGLRLLEMGYSAEKVLKEIADSDGADKAARFMQLCNAFDIPVVTLFCVPMADLVEQIQVSDEVAGALLRRSGFFGRLLDLRRRGALGALALLDHGRRRHGRRQR